MRNTKPVNHIKRTWIGKQLVQLRDKARLARPTTLLSLRLRSALSHKTKVGFGPIRTGERDLNVRKWRIDPIVHHINQNSDNYVADFFFDWDNLERFTIIVIVKSYSDRLVQELRRVKDRIVIFDVVDNPLGCKRSIYDDDEAARYLNGLILSSPRQANLLAKYALPVKIIEHPVINTTRKDNYGDTNFVTLIWQGFRHNARGTQRLEETIRGLAETTGTRIKLVYHTNAPASDDGFIQFVPWTVDNAFTILAAADIAISARDETRPWQEEKPSTKIIMYMAAGLPIVCTPTEAERLVIQNGVTGFFAFNQEEWQERLFRLIVDPSLRERVGRAARRHALSNFSVADITKKYLDFFDGLSAQSRPHKV